MSFARSFRSSIAPAALLIAVVSPTVRAQMDAIRRARAEVAGKLPSVSSLFGDKPPLSTSIDDALDGVPQLDGFEPAEFSPMEEMPRGTTGRFFLAPGAYTFDAEGFCLKAGTYGPTRGNGYLYAEFKGPKANVIRNILLRAYDHPSLSRADIQMLLWSILIQAKYDTWPPGVKSTAKAMLTQAELREVGSNGLDAVPEELKKRVLGSTPAPLRRVLEAENEMRRMLSGPNAAFEDLERVAVLAGEPPASELLDVVREGRWSYHPNGYFIRFHKDYYSLTRIQIYYPASFRIERDAKGRIISVTTADGRRAQHSGGASPAARTEASAWSTIASRSESHSIMRDAMRFALTDVRDLAEFRRNIASSHAHNAKELSTIATEAEHAALARYYGLRKQSSPEAIERLTATLLPVRTTRGYSYVVAPLTPSGSAWQSGGKSLSPFQPGGGAGVPGNSSQRSGSSSRSGSSDAAKKAEKVTKAMGNAAKLLGPAGGGGLPNAMVAAGIGQAMKAAGSADAALNGEDPPNDDAAASQSRDAESAKWTMISLSTRRQAPDFMVLSKPVDIEVPTVADASGAPAGQVAAANAVTASTLRLASTLSAAVLAKRRSRAAGAARNDEWENRQGQALLYLRRTAGEAMLTLSRDLAAYRAIATSNPAAYASIAQTTDAQNKLAAGFSPEVASAMKRLGMTDATLEQYRQELLAESAGQSSARTPEVLRALEDALREYGEYWTKLPVVAAPWN